MTLLDLPNELIIQILSDLTHRDLITCQLSNKQLYITIKDSVLLQFRIALSTFKTIDNPSSPLSLFERFKTLKDSENAWTHLHKDFRRRIGIQYEISGIYDLSAGVFLLGNAARTALHYIKLPSSVQDDVAWREIKLNQSQGTIIDMGFCLDEHDLLVVVTTKLHDSGIAVPTYDISLVLFKLSTGEPHPAAKASTIHVLTSEWDKPAIGVEIVGDRLVLILSYHDNPWMPDDRVFVYDWRNAELKMSFVAPFGSYSGLVFLSENLIVIPNAQTNTLEIWDIFSTTPSPACILQLPELAAGNSLVYITCRGEPNPVGSKSRLESKKPFFYAAHEAIILFHIRVQLGDPVTHQQEYGGALVFGYTYTLFVHRRALCEVYERRSTERSLGMLDISVQVEDPASEGSGLGEIIVDDDDDDDDGWESVGSENGGDAVVRAINDDPTPIHWLSWGPPVTRWFPADVNSTRWITTTAGQRAVLIGHSQHEVGCEYIVLDFNPENVQRAEKELESLPLGVESRLHCLRNIEGVQTDGVFMEDMIVSELPFVVCTSEEALPWDGALMDEERVLGLIVETGGRIKIIEVHHFGGAQS